MSDHLIAEANRHAKALPVATQDQPKEEDKTMSDTPRTDKRCSESQSLKSMSMRFAWMCDFARDLERENAALREALLVARNYVYWTDEKHSPEDYPQVMETIRKDRALIDAALGKEAQP